MAQVRKMNNGGSVQKLQYGSIIKNGTKYEMDEESMKHLEQYIAAADPDIQQSLADDWNLLRSGQDVTIDTFSNQRSTKPSDFSEGQMKRLGKDKSTESRWHGRFNTDVHKYNLATQYLGKFDPNNKVENTTVKIKLGPGSSKFEYITNDDGTRSYKSLMNQEEIDLFDNIAAYLAGDEAYRANYDVSGWAGFNTLDKWYKNLNNPNFLRDLRVKILNGQEFTPDEIDYLDYIGLGSNVTSNTKVEEQKANAELKAIQDKAWADFNVGNLWDTSLRDKQIIYDQTTGKYDLNPEYVPNGLPEGTQGYYFNDDFVKQYSGYGYDWLNGHVLFNNKWYNEADLYNPMSQLYQMLNNPNNDYYNKNRRGDYAGADAILKTDWDGVYHVPIMTDATAGRLGSIYQKPNLRYIEMDYNRPGATYRGNALDATYNIFRYQDFSDEEGMDGLGRRQERWTITDAYGNPVFLDGNVAINGIPTYNFNDFSGLYTGSSNEVDQKITYANRVSSDPNDKEYYNRYADTPLTDANGNNVIEGWVDPTTKTVHVAVNKAWGGTENTVFTNMPMDVYSAIKDRDFADNLNNGSNRILLDEFKQLIQGKNSDITANDLIILGISSEIAPYVIDYFKKYWESNPTPVNRPKMKNGGVLYLQPGGPVKHIGSTNYVSDKVNQLAAQMQNPTTSKVIGDGSGLTDTDKWELAALITDLASFTAGLVPVYGDAANLVGGQAANAMHAAVDRKRVKEGLAKPGTALKNWLISTGADVASIVPILGDAVNLGDFGRKALPILKRTYGVVTTGLATLGLPNAINAIDKLIAGEDFTMEDAQALATGLQAITGLSYRGARTLNDARLAAATEPKPKAIEHKFKFKNGDQEVTKTLEKGDIDAITRVRGRKNIEAKLAEIYKAKGVPEDQIPDLVRNTNYEQLGLTYKDNKWYYKDTVSEQVPDKKHGTGYYILHPSERSNALSSRTPADVSKVAQTKKGLNYAAGRWAVKTGNINKMRGTVDVSPERIGEHIWLDKYAKYNPSQPSIRPAIITAEAPTPKSKPIPETPAPRPKVDKPVVNPKLETPKSVSAKPEIKPVETNQHFGSDEFDQKFAQYQMFIRGNDSPSTKQFKKRFEEFAQKDDFRKLAEDNPELVRLMVDEEITNVLGKDKRTKNSENKLRKEIDDIKRKYGLKFKKGGILKGQGGFKYTPYWETPEWKTPQILTTPYSKKLDTLYNAETKLNPTGLITGSTYSGVNMDYTPVKTSSSTPETKVSPETTYTPSLFGSWPVDRKEFSMMPEAINQMFSLGRLGWDIGTNDKLYDIKARGLVESSNAKMASMPQEIYSRQTINAGDAEKELANRKMQELPAVNADYVKYASMKNAMNEASNIDLANSIRKNSLQNSENLARETEEQRMYANMRNQIEAHNRGIQAAKMAGLSELAAARTQANRQSFANYLLEKQTEFDQNRGKMEEAMLAENRLKWQEEADKGFEQDLQNKFGVVYNAAADKGNLTIEQWLSIHPEYVNEFNEIKKKWQRYVTDSELSFTKSQNPAKWMFKSGGSLRSASEQIKINKHKALDQNWVNGNKSVRKAIDKMSDRVHRIIMKILSDEI